MEKIGILLFGVPRIITIRKDVRLPNGQKKRTGEGKGSARRSILKQIRNRLLQHARRFGLVFDPVVLVTSDSANELPPPEVLSNGKWYAVCVGTRVSQDLLIPMLKDRYKDLPALIVIRWVPTKERKPLPKEIANLLKQEGVELIADDAFELAAYLARRASLVESTPKGGHQDKQGKPVVP